MADVLAPSCVGRIIKVDSACGCTLTRTTIDGLTPEAMVALSNTEIYMAKAILDAREAKMLGVQERGLITLLNSSIKDIKGKLNVDKIDEQSLVLPFIQRTQRSFINANYFTIEPGGLPTPGAGTGSIPVSAFDITVDVGPSVFQSTGDSIERYFVPGSTLIVLNWDNVATKNAQTVVYTIFAAVNADVGAVKKAKITVYPNVPASTWNGYTPTQKLPYQPQNGVAQTGANSIDDHEQYCNNQPTDLSRRIIVNWLQTTRESYCREQQYEEVLDAILAGKVNDYLAGFKYQSIADQHKQMAMRSQKEWFNSVFYGQAIDITNQTTVNYKSLPIVYDLVNTNCPLNYKASALGIFTQLNNCSRVVDMNGNHLSLDYIFNQLWLLKRNREADGDNIDVIDSMTDRYTAGLILDAMSKYYLARFSIQTTRYAKIGERITHDNIVLFNYNIYDIPDQGVQWAVFQDNYFDDMKSAFASSVVGWDFSVRANNLWFIDWSDVNVGVAATNSVTRKNPDPSVADIYKCVITPNIRTYELRSKTWTVMVDRPQRHLIIHNFANACPEVSINGCTVPQS